MLNLLKKLKPKKHIDPNNLLELSLYPLDVLYKELQWLFINDKEKFDKLIYSVFFNIKYPHLQPLFEMLLNNNYIQIDYSCATHIYKTHDYNKRHQEIQELYNRDYYKKTLFPKLEEIRKKAPLYQFTLFLSPDRKFIMLEHPSISNCIIDFFIYMGLISPPYKENRKFQYNENNKTENAHKISSNSPRKNPHYEVLGIESNATKEEIKKKYRELARKHHPDFSKDPNSIQIMQKINVAYDTIMKNFT